MEQSNLNQSGKLENDDRLHSLTICVKHKIQYSSAKEVFVVVNTSHSPFDLKGHSCKIGNMRHPGTLKNQNPQFEKIFNFFAFVMFV